MSEHTAENDATPWHEFTEDVADGSMCICGVPALTHHLVFPARDPYSPRITPPQVAAYRWTHPDGSVTVIDPREVEVVRVIPPEVGAS